MERRERGCGVESFWRQTRALGVEMIGFLATAVSFVQLCVRPDFRFVHEAHREGAVFVFTDRRRGSGECHLALKRQFWSSISDWT